MSFNWQTFRTRTLTAIVFAMVMLAGLLWNHWSFLVLFSVIHFGCWWEYLKLTEKIHKIQIDIIIKYFFCVCGFMIFLTIGFNNYSYDFVWMPFGYRLSLKWGLVIVTVFSFLAFFFQNKQIPIKAKWFVTAGFLYISLSWGLMIDLYSGLEIHLQDTYYILASNFIPIIIIASIWINDTMAYIIGSLIGKTLLARISPKKTWEGTIGGVILCVVVMAFLYPKIFYSLSGTEISTIAGSIALIAAVFGTIGDLLESKLKRMAGVKDSGSLMPGHGGFLDRFDSLLLATPFVWLYVQLFIK